MGSEIKYYTRIADPQAPDFIVKIKEGYFERKIF